MERKLLEELQTTKSKIKIARCMNLIIICKEYSIVYTVI